MSDLSNTCHNYAYSSIHLTHTQYAIKIGLCNVHEATDATIDIIIVDHN